mmetsp:Transcript_36366/g.107345  ORF Transcript_36366/g.107345 Transcript_36366/m.107345 type:complete len:218 (+) Transcript_36366:615-1268(+)
MLARAPRVAPASAPVPLPPPHVLPPRPLAVRCLWLRRHLHAPLRLRQPLQRAQPRGHRRCCPPAPRHPHPPRRLRAARQLALPPLAPPPPRACLALRPVPTRASMSCAPDAPPQRKPPPRCRCPWRSRCSRRSCPWRRQPARLRPTPRPPPRPRPPPLPWPPPRQALRRRAHRAAPRSPPAARPPGCSTPAASWQAAAPTAAQLSGRARLPGLPIGR